MAIKNIRDLKRAIKDLPGDMPAKIESIYEYRRTPKTAGIYDAEIKDGTFIIVPDRVAIKSAEDHSLEARHSDTVNR